MELRDLEGYGELGTVVYLADGAELMHHMPAGSVDAVFAEPPYRLPNGGVTVKSGRLVSEDKESWARWAWERTTARTCGTRSVTQCILRSDAALWVSSEVLGTITTISGSMPLYNVLGGDRTCLSFDRPTRSADHLGQWRAWRRTWVTAG